MISLFFLKQSRTFFEMNAILSFFANLSSRFGKENDLSDITWAMCQASPFFRAQWIKFFFPELDPEDIESIEREVPDENNLGSRVDFLLTQRNGDSPYLIEVKIWDQNHHFGQYEKSYAVEKNHLGYITNYYCKQEGYEVKQWREYYVFLLNQTKNLNPPVEEAELIYAYCEYLKSVCGMTMITEKIDITKMTSLYDLTVVLREVSEFSTDYFALRNYSTTHRDDLRWLFLEVEYKQCNEWGTQYPFLGILYQHTRPRICAGFDCRKGWARGIVEFMKKNSNKFSLVKSTYCTMPELGGDYYFFMSEYAKKQFEDADSIEEQKKVLKGFIEEAIMFPLRLKSLITDSGSIQKS